jgi:hypothetical protein
VIGGVLLGSKLAESDATFVSLDDEHTSSELDVLIAVLDLARKIIKGCLVGYVGSRTATFICALRQR